MEYCSQRVLGPRCGVKKTFDLRDSGCFILFNEVLHAFIILDHLHVIVNGKYLMSFTRYHYAALCDNDENEGCTVQFQHIHGMAI
jgi:hypothetical protein